MPINISKRVQIFWKFNYLCIKNENIIIWWTNFQVGTTTIICFGVIPKKKTKLILSKK